MFCPNCSTPLKTPEGQTCLNCGAVFGEGSAWIVVAAPPFGDNEQKSIGLARSGFALLLICIGICFLSLSLAWKGSAVGGTPPLILALVFVASGCVVVMAKSRKMRTAATVGGVLIFAVLVWIIGTVLANWPH